MRLNLPTFQVNLRKRDDGSIEIFDRLRAKFVALTPEEWVRQHFVNLLIEHMDYPAALMANEVGVLHNGCRRRCDTIIYGHDASPIAIVEYKAPSISITPRVFDQIVRYNMVLDVNYLMVSNGLVHYSCYIKHDSSSYVFTKEIPSYPSLQIRK